MEFWMHNREEANHFAPIQSAKTAEVTYHLIQTGRSTYILRPSTTGALMLREGEYLLKTFKAGTEIN